MFSRRERDSAIQAKQTELDEDERKKLEADLVELMRHPRFRRWAYHLLAVQCLTFSNPLVLGKNGRRATDLNCGRKAVGDWLLGEIDRLCPELWLACFTEAVRARSETNEIVAQLQKDLEDSNAR